MELLYVSKQVPDTSESETGSETNNLIPLNRLPLVL